MTRPDTPQPDDEQPVTPEHDSTVPAVEDDPTPDEQQQAPEHDLAQDDELRSGQYEPGR